MLPWSVSLNGDFKTPCVAITTRPEHDQNTNRTLEPRPTRALVHWPNWIHLRSTRWGKLFCLCPLDHGVRLPASFLVDPWTTRASCRSLDVVPTLHAPPCAPNDEMAACSRMCNDRQFSHRVLPCHLLALQIFFESCLLIQYAILPRVMLAGSCGGPC